MKQFRKWQNRRMIKTIGYLTNHGAYTAGEKQGWKAALEWALTQETDLEHTEIADAIKKELDSEGLEYEKNT